MLDSVDSDEKTKQAYPVNNPYGGYQVEEQWFLTKAGLYEVLMLSRKPVAKEFKKQVKALLHDLRTGKKDIVDINAMLTDPDNILKIAQNWKADRDRLRATETKLITAAQILLEDQAPKVLFADAVADSEGTVLIGTLAKILNDNGFPTGAIRFFEILRRDGYLGKSGDNYNMPTQRAMDLGLFRIIATAITHSDGRPDTRHTPKVTGKGQIYFVKKYLGKKAEIVDGELVIEGTKPAICTRNRA